MPNAQRMTTLRAAMKAHADKRLIGRTITEILWTRGSVLIVLDDGTGFSVGLDDEIFTHKKLYVDSLREVVNDAERKD